MPSKAITMLWIVLITLPATFLASKEDDEAMIRFIKLYHKEKDKSNGILLNEYGEKGKEYIHPDDPD